MANLFSPRGDDDAVLWDDYVGASAPTGPYRGVAHAKVDIWQHKRDGRISTRLSWNNPADWSDGERSLVEYLGDAISSRDPGGGEQLLIRPEFYPSGLRELAEWIAQSGDQGGDRLVPTIFAQLFDAVQGEDGGDAGEEVDPAEAGGGNIRMWSDSGIPNWMELKGEWLLSPKGAEATRLVENLPVGCCAITALACSGVNHRDLESLNTAEWVGASVDQLAAFLDKLGRNYQLVDCLGRTVKHAHSPGRPTTRMVVANGHCTAFKSNVWIKTSLTDPKRLITINRAPNVVRDIIAVCEMFLPLRGALTLESDVFARMSRIGPRGYTAAYNTQENCSLDFNAAYTSILTNPQFVFPKAVGSETVEEYDWRSAWLSEIKPHGFYLWSPLGLDREERACLLNGERTGWTLGAVLIQLQHDPVLIGGHYVTETFAPGKSLEDEDGLIWQSALARLVEPPRDNTLRESKRVTKDIYRAIVVYSGYLEKTEGTSTLVTGVHGSDVPYLRARADKDLDYTPYGPVGHADDGTRAMEFLRTTVYRKGGGPAKLAVYCYMGLILWHLWKWVTHIDPGAQLESIRTDAMNLRITIPKELLVERLKSVGLVGTGLSQWKTQPTWPASGEDRREYEEISVVPPSMALKPPAVFDLETALRGLETGTLSPHLAVFGPPGSGKTTQVLEKRILPAIRARGLTPVVLTPYRSHADRLECPTLASFLSSKRDQRLVAKSLEKVVVIVDEAGLVEPVHWVMLNRLCPAGCVVLGDPFQLTRCGDLFDIVARLNMPICWTTYHDRDRFASEDQQSMHETLQVLDAVCLEDQQAGKYRRSGYGSFPAGLEDKLHHVRFYASVELAKEALLDCGPILVCGWRHKNTDQNPEFEGMESSTVHALQGRTVKSALLIADYDCDPRLLRTALSRAISLKYVAVVRRPTHKSWRDVRGTRPPIQFLE